MAAPGLTSVWNVPRHSPPRTLTAPISVMPQSVGGAAGGLEVDHAERDVVQRRAEVVEAALADRGSIGPSGGTLSGRPRSSSSERAYRAVEATFDRQARRPSSDPGGRYDRPVTPPATAARPAATSPGSTSPPPAGPAPSTTTRSAASSRSRTSRCSSESVEEVACRWCGTGASVIELSPTTAAPRLGPARAGARHCHTPSVGFGGRVERPVRPVAGRTHGDPCDCPRCRPTNRSSSTATTASCSTPTTCDDCIVTFLCSREPDDAVVIDVAEVRALRLLADSGLAPPLRHRRHAG